MRTTVTTTFKDGSVDIQASFLTSAAIDNVIAKLELVGVIKEIHINTPDIATFQPALDFAISHDPERTTPLGRWVDGFLYQMDVTECCGCVAEHYYSILVSQPNDIIAAMI